MKFPTTSLEWLQTLVSFDTTSRNSNLELISLIKEWFKKHGIESRLTYDETKLKANLFATLGQETKGGLILSGHTDVVPVDGQAWDTDPFHTIEKDGKIYGRGTCDMKGFLAVVLALLPEFIQLKLKKPLHFAFSYDEEVGCLGVRSLIADLRGVPDACIVGEPTEMRPVIAHKGINVFRCKIEGRAAHSSLTPQGCNAIDYAAELIQWLKRLASELKAELVDPDYDVPFTTLSTNLIQGGNAVNTIPASCEFTFEFRNLPEITPDTILEKIKKYITAELLPKMQKEFPESKIGIEEICRVPGLKNTHETSIAELVRQVTSIQTKHKVAYATEAGLFQQAGIPTVICGPGNIEQAHRANEYVEVTQIKKCEEFLLSLLRHL